MTAESGRLRITLDERLTFCRPQIVGVIGAEIAPSPADVIAPGPARILEIKHWGDRPVWLAWALHGLEPAHSFSKFKMGMAALNRAGSARGRRDATPADDADADAGSGRRTPTSRPTRARPETHHATGMFIAFEGIDGSGKTTLSNRVATALRERGLTVEHAREGGWFASRVTQSIRDLCRDARNLALVPRAELLLYVAREIQLAEEVVIPALSRADVVITDRYLYTAEVLARHVRQLPDATIRAIIDDAAGGVWPDMVFLVDVDPIGRARPPQGREDHVARAAARVAQGAGGQRPRAAPARRAISRSRRAIPIAGSSSTTPTPIWTQMVAAHLRRPSSRRAPWARRRRSRARAPRAPATTPRPPRRRRGAIDSPEAALAAFLGWVDDRAQREPTLAAYVLSGLAGHGIDERRLALAARVPRVIARGLRGLSDGVSWRLRRSLVEAAPQRDRDVARRSGGRGAAGLDAARAAGGGRAGRGRGEPAGASTTRPPGRCATSSTIACPTRCWRRWRCSTTPRAWRWRERWIRERGTLDAAVASYVNARAAARSVTGRGRGARLGDPARRPRRRAGAGHRVDRAACPATGPGAGASACSAARPRPCCRRSPASTTGAPGRCAWRWRRAAARRSIRCIGLDHPTAWELREGCLELWPACAIKSLGVLVNGARGKELLHRALALFPDNISLLKQAAGIATGSNLNPTVMAA